MKEANYFCPITAPEKNDTPESILDRWDKFDLLIPEDQEKVSSKNSTAIIKKISDFFQLNQEQAGHISIAIRNYYFKKLAKEAFSIYLSEQIPLDIAKAQEITKLVFQKIISNNSQEEMAQAQIEKLPLPNAIKKYPAIGEQVVTESRITLKNVSEPVRASVKNWLSDYTFNMGFDAHDSATRGLYLFQNKNTKGLTGPEQKKLSFLLKAFDTNEVLSINVVSKEIVFPREEVLQKPLPEAPQKNISFSLLSSKKEVAPKKIGFFRIASPEAKKELSPIPSEVHPRAKITKPNISGTFILPSKKITEESFVKNEKQPLNLKERAFSNSVPVSGGSGAFEPLTILKKPDAVNEDLSQEERMPLKKHEPLTFTSPQKMPFEKKTPEKTTTPEPKTPEKEILSPQPIKITPRNFQNNNSEETNSSLKV